MTRDEALAAYWSATSHAEEHAAYQWLIRLGIVDGELCPECGVPGVQGVPGVPAVNRAR